MDNKRDGFFMYRSYFEAINTVEDDLERLKLYDAIMGYGMDGVDPNLKGMAKGLFLTWKINIDNSHARRDAAISNGKRGGRPKKVDNYPNTNPILPKSNQNKTIENPNQYLVNLEETSINPNNNINQNSDFKFNVEGEITTISIDEDLFISNYLSDAPEEGGIVDNKIEKLDLIFNFKDRYNKIVSENTSTSLDEILKELLIQFNDQFGTINLKKIEVEPFTEYKYYQKIIINNTEPKVIFYELVILFQYMLTEDDPRMINIIKK